MNHHFKDVDYLTGRRMRRSQHHAMTNDREQHLKRSLKSGLKKSQDPPPPRDDANVFAKLMRERQLLHPCTRTRRVTTEPNLDIFGIPEAKHAPPILPASDIFGNQNPRNHLGIFGQSKCGSSYDYKRERKKKVKIKSKSRETEPVAKSKFKLNPLEKNIEYINQLIAPGSYEDVKWIVDSSNLFV